jgi:hypothetical protein
MEKFYSNIRDYSNIDRFKKVKDCIKKKLEAKNINLINFLMIAFVIQKNTCIYGSKLVYINLL